jgi:hypothetical protein
MLKKIDFIGDDTENFKEIKNSVSEISQNTQPELINFQIDFLKLEIPMEEFDVPFEEMGIKWENLTEHPTIKNQFVLKTETWQYAKNFSIYFGMKSIVLRFSLPYLLYGHNYCATVLEDFYNVKTLIKDLIGIDITFSEIKELEFGAYEKINVDAKDYIDSIVGIKNYELEKSTKGFKMFGDRKKKFHYKIYDAVANAKAKKTFTLGKYPEKGLLKHEIKLTNTCPYFDSIFYLDLYEPLCSYWDELKEDLIDCQNSLAFKNNNPVLLHDTDLIHILYVGLKQYESGVAFENVVRSLFDLIENSGLTPSQKSKRRKAINLLEDQYNQRF